jgi:uncharacterized membrane protein
MKIFCGHCKSNAAEIFQVNGDYCLNCWQEITHTTLEPAGRQIINDPFISAIEKVKQVARPEKPQM